MAPSGSGAAAPSGRPSAGAAFGGISARTWLPPRVAPAETSDRPHRALGRCPPAARIAAWEDPLRISVQDNARAGDPHSAGPRTLGGNGAPGLAPTPTPPPQPHERRPPSRRIRSGPGLCRALAIGTRRPTRFEDDQQRRDRRAELVGATSIGLVTDPTIADPGGPTDCTVCSTSEVFGLGSLPVSTSTAGSPLAAAAPTNWSPSRPGVVGQP